MTWIRGYDGTDVPHPGEEANDDGGRAVQAARRGAMLDTLNHGVGAWYVRRASASRYQFIRAVAGGRHVLIDFTQLAGLPGGSDVHQLNRYYLGAGAMLSTDQEDPTALRSGTWSAVQNAQLSYHGSYRYTGCPGAKVTYPVPRGALRLGLRALRAADAGLARVLVDGDAHRADLLPTAQEVVAAGAYPTSILATHGGPLATTDRVLDQYAVDTVWDHPVAVADDLDPARAHTVTVENVGVVHPQGSGLRVYDSGVSYGFIGTDPTTPGAVVPILRTLMGVDSAWEYAYNVAPAGTDTAVFVGNLHGYEVQAGLDVVVDGTPLAFADGQIVAVGSDATITRTSTLGHPGTPEDIARVVTTYTLGEPGLTVRHVERWLTRLVCTAAYQVMYPTSGLVFDAVQFDVSPTIHTAFVGAGGNGTGPHDCATVVLWDRDGRMVTGVHAPRHRRVHAGSAAMTWVEDRRPSASEKLNKVYFTRIDSPTFIEAGDVWRSEATYKWARYPGGLAHVLPVSPK